MYLTIGLDVKQLLWECLKLDFPLWYYIRIAIENRMRNTALHTVILLPSDAPVGVSVL